ncbi:cholesterol oxidase substrate-binding domain-containing protein [Saccharothrix syringae]|uniref:FAD-binding protein n=1 Tax=Saccharothrix syringae TaxID=103733 RepID=A0A5Q0H144_SACSY|nr:cholesterol oxidase substrate-binding domain-containing protein [Saccharothrix syringae]QFZ19564.1 FAD-binding protein [Saccharothrix syringae]
MTRALSGRAHDAPPGFPRALPVRRRPYRNWVDRIHVDDVWTCSPRTAEDVVALANWAWSHGYRVRAAGEGHSVGPLVLTDRQPDAQRVVLADTRDHLDHVQVLPGEAPLVRVGPGASVRSLLEHLARHGLALPCTTGCGEFTVGGALAVGGHGTGAAAPAHGTMSDLVVALDAVVWDAASGRYAVRGFRRGDPDTAALLTHVGRAFVTEVTLAAVADHTLRCASDTTALSGEVFAAPEAAAPRSVAALVERCGAVDVLWFPYSERTWLRTFEPAPVRPPTSRAVTGPYNYPFTDHIPEAVSRVVSRVVGEHPRYALGLGEAQHAASVAGLAATASADLWGRSKDLLLYSRPNVLRYAWSGHAIVTCRAELQRVVHDFAVRYRELRDGYRDRERYPANGPVELRVTGVDHAGGPTLSPVAADPDHPHWDVAVWVSVLGFPGTGHAESFHRDLERFAFDHYRPPYAVVRPEWAKGWGYTTSAGWADAAVLGGAVPAAFGASWNRVVTRLDALDPHRVFGNPFLDRLLVAGSGGRT